MSRGKAYFDLSTNSPTMVRKINTAFAERDVYMLDSPVSGGPRGARTGKLALWVGGDEQIFNRYKPVLDAMGDKARYVGPIGAGSVAKLVHNGAGYCIQTALAEMFSVGVKAGVEPLALWEAVRDGAGGRRRTFDGLVDQFLPGKYEPAAFALRLAHKDMSLATQLGRDFNVPMRIANLALAELSEALNRGWGDRDSRSPMILQQERAGVEIRVDAKRIEEVLERDPPAYGNLGSGGAAAVPAVFAVLAANYQRTNTGPPRKSWPARGSADKKQRVSPLFPAVRLATNSNGKDSPAAESGMSEAW
jgi:3-hydroxyisobutyrate dehydrogenase